MGVIFLEVHYNTSYSVTCFNIMFLTFKAEQTL